MHKRNPFLTKYIGTVKMLISKVFQHNQQPEQPQYVDVATGKLVRNKAILKFVQGLRIPPAYTNVTIDTNPGAKAVAWGFDTKGRKQIMYNQWYIDDQQRQKYQRVWELRRVYAKVYRDATNRLPDKKEPLYLRLISLVIILMVECNFRIGHDKYLKRYKSYGITTLTWKHIVFIPDAEQVEISFIGKKGVMNKSICKMGIVRDFLEELRAMHATRQKPQKQSPVIERVFFCPTLHRCIQASDVNDFLQTYHPDISSKDIRTWRANKLYTDAAKKLSRKCSDTSKVHREALKQVAAALHNTPAVCATSYIDPNVKFA